MIQARSKPESERPRLIVEFVLENLAKKRLHEQKVAERRQKEDVLVSTGVVRRHRPSSSVASINDKTAGGPGIVQGEVNDATLLAESALRAGVKRRRSFDAAPARGESIRRPTLPPRSSTELHGKRPNPSDSYGSGPRQSPFKSHDASLLEQDSGIVRALGLERPVSQGAEKRVSERRVGRKRLQQEDAFHEALVRGYTKAQTERHSRTGQTSNGRLGGPGVASVVSGSNTVNTDGRLAAKRLAAATLFGAGGSVDPKWID